MGFRERMLKLIGVWNPEESGFTRTCGWCSEYATRTVQLQGRDGQFLDVAHCDSHTPQGNAEVDAFLDGASSGIRAERMS